MTPKEIEILVFGSNTLGIHGKGAAKEAYKNHGALMGVGEGHRGNSYAIPTKDRYMETLPLVDIKDHVQKFIFYAQMHPYLNFKVTQIGCGLAGLDPADMAPMFKGTPANCRFDEAWKPWLGDIKSYWGTFSG
jgi:hypothetical protein